MPLYLFILFIVAYFCASLRCRRRRCGCCLVLTLVTLSSGGRRVCLWAVGQWKLRCKRLSGSSGAYRRLSRAEEGRIGEDRGRSGKGGRVANSSSNRRPLERLQVALPFPMDRVSQKVRGSREPFKIDRWWVHKGVILPGSTWLIWLMMYQNRTTHSPTSIIWWDTEILPFFVPHTRFVGRLCMLRPHVCARWALLLYGSCHSCLCTFQIITANSETFVWTCFVFDHAFSWWY